MYVSISKSGPKAQVIAQLRSEAGDAQDDKAVETQLKIAVAEHLEEHAKDDTTVGVSISGSLTYEVA